MQREYGVDITDLWRGRLSLRRLVVLIQGLPSTSRFARIYSDADELFAVWSLSDLLLARVHDELAALRWQWESAHLDTKKQRPRAQPTPITPEVGGSRRADVIPLVSPHKLGGFIDDDTGRHAHG